MSQNLDKYCRIKLLMDEIYIVGHEIVTTEKFPGMFTIILKVSSFI